MRIAISILHALDMLLSDEDRSVGQRGVGKYIGDGVTVNLALVLRTRAGAKWAIMRPDR
jgi:hypothetical protein